MFERNKKVLCVIPARGGSKGVPKKNLRKIQGITLVSRAINCAQNSKYISRIFVSTDLDAIISECKNNNCEPHEKRPADLSGDLVGDVEVLDHAVLSSEKYYKETYDLIVMLQPTSPIRRSEEVDEAIKLCLNSNSTSVWTVSKVDLKFHPLKALTITNGGLASFDPRGNQIIARQQLRETYIRNGVAYVVSRNTLIQEQSLMGEICKPLVLPDIRISIDHEDDISLCEKIILEKNL